MDIAERFICHIWDNGHFREQDLHTQTGRKVKILSPGNWNTFQGPDFKNAKIKLGSDKEQIGDVEVHIKPKHWYQHGHENDENYDSVILHVVMWAEETPLTFNSQEEKIEVLELFEVLDDSIEKLFEEYKIKDRKVATRKCDTLSSNKNLLKILNNCGTKRFKEKASKFSRLSEKVGYEQALYSGILKSLGYSKNKSPMETLSQKLPVERLRRIIASKPEAETVIIIQSLFFGIAGLLPSQNPTLFSELESPSESYIDEIENLWELFKNNFTPLHKSDWQFFRVRPSNFPSKRLAAGAHLFAKIIKKGLLNSFISFFYNSLGKDEKLEDWFRELIFKDYWTTHYKFGGKEHKAQNYLLGEKRARIISINIILPTLYSFFESNGDKNDASKVMNYFSEYKNLGENSITKLLKSRIWRDEEDATTKINTEKSKQGLIYVFKEYCSKGKCNNCILLKKS